MDANLSELIVRVALVGSCLADGDKRFGKELMGARVTAK